MSVNIGEKIKALRTAADLTQEELANRAMLTKGFISQLENMNFKTSISIDSLSDIVDALGVSLAEFFTDEEEQQVVYSINDRIPVESDGAHKFELLVAGSTNNIMDPIMIELAPGEAMPASDPHQGEQFGLVLKGSLTMIVKKKKHIIKKNECFYFSSNKTYQFQNKSTKPVTFLWVTTPPQM